jgi:hypothetical protein
MQQYSHHLVEVAVADLIVPHQDLMLNRVDVEVVVPLKHRPHLLLVV